MGDTAPKAEAIHLTETAAPHPSSPDNPCADGPVDPAEIRFRPGVRREGAFRVRYVTIHGYRRAYVKAGSGPALLLIHGIGDSSDTWRPVVEQLAEHYTVIAPDLLGHGRSEKPRADYSVAGFANGMRDLLSVLEVDRVTVVGHSLGGGVAAQFAYQFPERCERLVLVGSGGVGRTVSPLLRVAAVPGIEAAHAVPRTAARSASPAAWVRACCVSSTPRSDATPRRSWPCSTRCPTPRPAWPSCAPSARASTGTGQVITMVDRAYLAEGIPTLIMWGRRDAIIPLVTAA